MQCGEPVPLPAHVCPVREGQGPGIVLQQASPQPEGGEVSQSALQVSEEHGVCGLFHIQGEGPAPGGPLLSKPEFKNMPSRGGGGVVTYCE